jgi:phosphatidate cytidylyltransferase
MKRILTALVLIPIIVYVVLWANYWVFALVLASAACLSYREYDAIAARYGFGAPGILGYGIGLLLLFWERQREPWLLIAVAALLALALALRTNELGKALPRAALLVMGVIYVFGCWKCALLLREANHHWLMYGLLVNWAGDIGAYYVGRNFGRRKLAEHISPQKTWEGAVGSLATSVLLAGAYLWRFLPGVGWPQIIGLTLAANAAGQVGDLAESAMKRGASIKDSGAILPGHGGFLDRVDSTLFALPVIYAYLQLTVTMK